VAQHVNVLCATRSRDPDTKVHSGTACECIMRNKLMRAMNEARKHAHVRTDTRQ
jgi:hypothetical protein